MFLILELGTFIPISLEDRPFQSDDSTERKIKVIEKDIERNDLQKDIFETQSYWKITKDSIFSKKLESLSQRLYIDPELDKSYQEEYYDLIFTSEEPITSTQLKILQSLISEMSGMIIDDLIKINSLRISIPKNLVDEFYQSLSVIAFDHQEFYLSPQLGHKLTEFSNIIDNNIISSLNDTYQSLQWYLDKIDLPKAWRKSVGSKNIIIAIVDTGIDQNHPEFQGHIHPNSYNFYHGNTNITDYNSHGTHVAGILSAESNNSIGIAGIANVTLLIEKAFHIEDTTGETILANSIIHATDNGAKIISNSWASENYSAVIHNAIKYANDRGVITVFAAGNNNTDQLFYPAALPETIAVGATDSSDNKASYSNYGSYINLTAPGSSIYSTLPRNSYGYKSGTSMATPIVAGIFGLLYSYYETEVNSSIIYQSLNKIVDDKGTMGRDTTYGWGRINANKALTLINRPFIANWNYSSGGGELLIEEETLLEWSIDDPDIDQTHYSALSLIWDNNINEKLLMNSTETMHYFSAQGLQNRSDYRFKLQIFDGKNSHEYVSPEIIILNFPNKPIIIWESPMFNGQKFENKENISIRFTIIELDNKSVSFQLFLEILDRESIFLIEAKDKTMAKTFSITWNSSDYPNGVVNYKLQVTNGYYQEFSTFDNFILNNTHEPKIFISVTPFYRTTLTNVTWNRGWINYTIQDFDTENITIEIQTRINGGAWKQLYKEDLEKIFNFTSSTSYNYLENEVSDGDILEIVISANDSIYSNQKTLFVVLGKPKEPVITILYPTTQLTFNTSFLIQWRVFDEDSKELFTVIKYFEIENSVPVVLIASDTLTKNGSVSEYFIDIDLSIFTTGTHVFVIEIADGYHNITKILNNIKIQKSNTFITSISFGKPLTSPFTTNSSKTTPFHYLGFVLSIVVILLSRKRTKK